MIHYPKTRPEKFPGETWRKGKLIECGIINHKKNRSVTNKTRLPVISSLTHWRQPVLDTMKTIMILKNDHNPNRFYLIDALAQRWMKMGYKVVTHYGTKNLPSADIAILHIDKTIVPDEYSECLSQYSIVLNRNALDISKSLISKNMVRPEEDYSGPVIIKTNANFGGVREAREKSPSQKEKKWLRWLLKMKPNWEKIDSLNPHKYPIFKNKKSIPAGVWTNKNLIVEKFLPEIENGLFFLRYWIFFGEQGWAGRFGAKKPIIKFRKRVTKDELIPIPDELKLVRKKLGFDYGRFDFVQHDGKPVLYDVNKTLGVGRGAQQLEAYSAQLDILASGINGF